MNNCGCVKIVFLIFAAVQSTVNSLMRELVRAAYATRFDRRTRVFVMSFVSDCKLANHALVA